MRMRRLCWWWRFRTCDVISHKTAPTTPAILRAHRSITVAAQNVVVSANQPKIMDQSAAREARYVLTLEEIGNLAQEGGKPAETLMNLVALIAKRFQTDVCSAYLLEPDRANLVLAATLGFRPECIGALRLALHEGLVGPVAEQV